MYSSTLSLTSARVAGGWSTPRPGRFTPEERPATHCIGGWVGPRAGLEGYGKSSPGIRFPGRPSRSESLYRLNFPAHNECKYYMYILTYIPLKQ
jgi:hypothetical protein